MRQKVPTLIAFSFIFTACAIFILFPTPARACDILETVLVEGITTTRIRTTQEPCVASAPAELPGLVLPGVVGPVPFDSSLGGGPNASSGPAPGTPGGGPRDIRTPINNPSSLSVAAEINDCGDLPTGGGLGRAINEAMRDIGERLGETVWSETLRGLRRSGEAGKILSNIFRDGIREVASDLGERGSAAVGNIVEDEVQDLFGDSRLGRAAGRIIGDAAGDLAEEYSQRAIEGIIDQVGLGEIGGLLGGKVSAEGVGNAVGNIFAGSVPVAAQGVEREIRRTAEETDSILTATRGILDSARETQERKVAYECGTLPLAQRLINQALEERTLRELQQAANLTVRNFPEFVDTAGVTAAEEYIEYIRTRGLPGDVELAAQLTQYLTDLRNPPVVDCQQNTGNDIDSLMMQWLSPEQCTRSGRATYQENRLRNMMADAQRIAAESLAGNIRPGISCLGRPDITNIEECPPNRVINNLSASQIAAQTERALATPRDRLLSGEVISDVFNDLLDEVFSTLGDEIEGGIRGLSNRRGSRRVEPRSSRTTAPASTGSYVDQLTGGPLTIGERSDLVSQNIATAASVEDAYRVILETKITNLEGTAVVFRNLHACYQTLANASPTAITKEEAKNRAETASSTVATIFTPQINEQSRLRSISFATASRLQGLATQAAGETDTRNLRAIAAAYQEMVDAKLTHTTSELQVLSNDLAGDTDALGIIKENAGIQLAVCQRGGV